MIYFDNAATTLQKPKQVGQNVLYAMQHFASVGRGSHRPGALAAEAVFRCREKLCHLFHMENPEQVVFTSNATHGLNIAIHSYDLKGKKVVVSGFEHNAVIRPLQYSGANIVYAFHDLFSPKETFEAFKRQIDSDTALVVCTHVSNVFGSRLPIEAIGAYCRQEKIPFVVDASQSAGVLDLDVPHLGADFVAMPGHKSLYGPQGTGVLLCRQDFVPLLSGGTGGNSRSLTMPDFLPDGLEAGTHNVSGIYGLSAGVDFVLQKTQSRISAYEQRLLQRAKAGLRSIPGFQVFAAPDPINQSAVLSFRYRDEPSETVGAYYATNGIALRAGLHCAPTAHRFAETLETGTVRASFSVFNQMWEVNRFLTVSESLLHK